jgi:menaquinone-dependent protoporphyrinogen IX oxidase
MTKTAVLYKSKYGFSKQYARWISDDTGGDLFELNKISIEELGRYDTIIMGGGIYAGGIRGMSLMKKIYSRLTNKKVILFSVGSSALGQNNTEMIKARNLTQEMQNSVPFFCLRGGLDYPAMKTLDRACMNLMASVIRKKEEGARSAEEKEVLAFHGTKISFLDRASLAPLISATKD